MAGRAARILRVGMAVCCAAGCLRGAGQAWGQGQAAASDAVYALHGTVVDGLSGKPVEKALVASSDRRLAAMTDSEGRFSIELRVPAGAAGEGVTGERRSFDEESPRASILQEMMGIDLAVVATKPGYMQTSGPVPVSIGPALSATELTLKLMPLATITGHVSANGTEVASNVQVLLFRREPDGSGRYGWSQGGMTTTNSHGDFRFPQQVAGDLTVMAAGWKGDPAEVQPPTALHEEYPATFYGDGKDFESATKLHVHYGDTVWVDLHLQAVTYYPVTIPVQGGRGEGLSNDQFNVQIIGGVNLWDGDLFYNARDHAVEGSLPSGAYRLMLSTAGEQEEVAQVSLSVEGAAVRTKPVKLVAAANVLVRVQTQFTRPDPAAAQTSQTAGAGVQGDSPVKVDRNDVPMVGLLLQPDGVGIVNDEAPEQSSNGPEFLLRNVQPGRYLVEASSQRGYVASLTSGGVDLMQVPLVVSAGATVAPIEVMLRDDMATVSGTVSRGEGATVGLDFVCLLPRDSMGQFDTVVVGPDGKFSVTDVVPGSYRMIAFEGGARTIPYRDAEAMRAYDGKGVTIEVTPGQTVEVEVPVVEPANGEGWQRVTVE